MSSLKTWEGATIWDLAIAANGNLGVAVQLAKDNGLELDDDLATLTDIVISDSIKDYKPSPVEKVSPVEINKPLVVSGAESIFDIILQKYGTLDGIKNFLRANDKDLDVQLFNGDALIGGPSLNKPLTAYLTAKGIKFSTYKEETLVASWLGDFDGLETEVAYSVYRRLYSTYSGPLVRLRRVSDNAEMDFGYIEAGFGEEQILDSDSITTWIGGSSAKVVTVYDQSGNGNNCSVASSSFQSDLALNSNDINSKAPEIPGIDFTSVSNHVNKSLKLDSQVDIDTGEFIANNVLFNTASTIYSWAEISYSTLGADPATSMQSRMFRVPTLYYWWPTFNVDNQNIVGSFYSYRKSGETVTAGHTGGPPNVGDGGAEQTHHVDLSSFDCGPSKIWTGRQNLALHFEGFLSKNASSEQIDLLRTISQKQSELYRNLYP